MSKILDFFKKAADTYKEYKTVADTAIGVGKAYLDYKDAKRRNELEEAAYDDYMKAAEAAGQEAQAAIDLNLTPMTITNLPTKKADVTSFTKATGVKDGGIMRLKDGTPDPNAGITALRKVRPDVVAKMGFAGGGGPGIEALRKKAPEVVKRMGFKEGMSEEMIESVSYEPGNYTEEEIEAYENYKYDMNEQKPGFPIMEIDDFLRFFMSPYSKKDQDSEMMMASEPGIDASRNELAMQLFGKTLDLLSAEEMEMLNEAIGESMAKGGIAAFAKGGRARYDSGTEFIVKKSDVEESPRMSQQSPSARKLESDQFDLPKEFNVNDIIISIDDKNLGMTYGGPPIIVKDVMTGKYKVMGNDGRVVEFDTIEEAKIYTKQIAPFAKGGRVKRNVGGIMDLGGMEKDYRFTGGFVPIGEYERKDDVPARLSKNEFVFTADAVRAAGGGSIQKGAKRMYDTMKNLEAKPQAKGMMA